MSAILDFIDVKVAFGPSPTLAVPVVHGIDLAVNTGEIMGLVGESGSGKSVSCLAALSLAGPQAHVTGSVRFGDANLLSLSELEMSKLRGRELAMIFQDPMSSLNPVKTLRSQMFEAIHLNNPAFAKADRSKLTAEAVRLLEEVGIPEPATRLSSYPHQLSGGMSQRAMIAMMLAGSPALLIADEPTTALDVTIQAQILRLLGALSKERGMAIILITHDLGVIAETCDRVAVMYCGRIVEIGSVASVFASPAHPYTRGLLDSRPRADQGDVKLTPIGGVVPSPFNLPAGCAFAPRCGRASDTCADAIPPFELADDRGAACFHPIKAVGKKNCCGSGMMDKQLKPMDGLGPLLSVRNLRLTFSDGFGGWFGNRRHVHAVDGVSFEVSRGEVLGIVGESSSGKSSVAKAILNIHSPSAGQVIFDGEDLDRLKPREWRDMRREIQYVFQDPLGALDPRMTVLSQVIEPLTIHNIGNTIERRRQAHDLLEAVGLLSESHEKYPHELSGGQRQRVVLARSLILKPRLLICDEPVSALDVSIQAQVIQLLEELKDSFDLTIMFISHDLSLIRYFCDTMVVMYLGRIVESGTTEELFANPKHPYTQALISAIPVAEPGLKHDIIALQGEPPNPFNPPAGCHFHPRCRLKETICQSAYPDLEPAGGGSQLVACHVVAGRKQDK